MEPSDLLMVDAAAPIGLTRRLQTFAPPLLFFEDNDLIMFRMRFCASSRLSCATTNTKPRIFLEKAACVEKVTAVIFEKYHRHFEDDTTCALA
jgi:hypothetical protein